MIKKIYRVMVKIGNIDAPYTGHWYSTKWEAEIELSKARKEYKIAWIEEREFDYES